MISCLGAHLGVLLNAMLDAGSSPEAPSSYVFGQACGVLLKSDEGQGYDGAAQRECMEFFEKLLDHLDAEELNERTENLDAPSLVRELFGLEAVTKVSRLFSLCYLCTNFEQDQVPVLWTCSGLLCRAEVCVHYRYASSSGQKTKQ